MPWIRLQHHSQPQGIVDAKEVAGDAPSIGLVERGYLYLASADGASALRANHAVQREHQAGRAGGAGGDVERVAGGRVAGGADPVRTIAGEEQSSPGQRSGERNSLFPIPIRRNLFPKLIS